MAQYQTSAITDIGGLENSLVANAPSGVTAGDVLVASITCDTIVSSLGITWTGWTEISRQYNSGPDRQLLIVLARVATGSESYTITATGDSSVQATVVIARFNNVDSALPTNFANTANNSNNASPISISLTGITASSNSCIVVYSALDQQGRFDIWSYSTISGYTKQVDHANGDWNTATLQTRDNVSAGATGTLTCTATRSSGSGGSGYAGIVLELPAAGAATTGRLIGGSLINGMLIRN